MKAVLRFVKRHTSPLFRVCFLVLAACYLLLFLAEISVGAADFLNTTLCQGVRFLLAKLTTALPFSLGEWLILLSPLYLTFFVLLGVIRFSDRAGRVRFIGFLLSVVCLIASLHILTLGIAYRTTGADEKIGHPREAVTAQELASTAAYLLMRTEQELDRVDFSESGASVMPYGVDELSRKLCDGYRTLGGDYPGLVGTFSTRVKPLVASRIMSYAHLLGIYSFYTGESNLNVDYTDYNFPYTAAHEFAHQRGVIREDEANFIAFLVCERSDDAYIRYSGYLNLFEYVSSALYTADRDAYREIVSGMDERIRGELMAYRRHHEQYEGTKFGEISEALNDSYLQFNGTEGSVSYGFVVDLAVAYLEERVGDR